MNAIDMLARCAKHQGGADPPIQDPVYWATRSGPEGRPDSAIQPTGFVADPTDRGRDDARRIEVEDAGWG